MAGGLQTRGSLTESTSNGDVWNSPEWLRATAQGRGKLAREARRRLAELPRERAEAQQQRQFERSHAQQESLRRDAMAMREREFAEREKDRQAAAEQQKANQGNASEDRRAAQMNELLRDPNTKPEVREAIQNSILQRGGVSATLPVDPKAAALARSKGLPEPQPQVVGGSGGGGGGAPTVATGGARPNVSATGAVDQGQGFSSGYPILPNTPEQRTPGHAALEGSRVVERDGKLGINTPSGGYIGGVSHNQVANHPDWSPAQLANEPAAKPATGASATGGAEGAAPTSTRGPVSQFFAPPGSGIAHLFGLDEGAKAITQQPTTPAAPLNASIGKGPGFTNTSTTPWSPSQLAGEPQTASTGPQTNPTPAPGTQFQGPVTAAAEFVGQPNAPVAQPAGTPPAIPPTERLTPEDERRRQLVNQ